MSDLKLTFPTVHRNGSGAEMLTEVNERAGKAVDHAIDMMRAAAPHGRDFYTQAHGSYLLAAAEHNARIAKLVQVRNELDAIITDVYRQKAGR